ncbi:ROK family protein [Nakamurella multipartita]|uniref:ROK family protein n=1 Tax=Nakamurella multipartita (strain ATCC 700099 / DSM 44233 / CIP 104796 / JCM 9543 / NBRC 105858 / Y-104) TaxID=479431 RepID=C8XCV8_NAKMY|nr:ROK family protein [Nakamurella multipartita]ACV79561.1 ROK family protein [Nakamurella multipartita DSM 44233]
MSKTIGIDIGGTSVRAAVIDGISIGPSLREATPHTERETEDLLVTLITKLAASQPVSAVGLAVAGFVSADRQRVMFAPHLAWRDAPVPERVSARVGLPVVMDHDVNSAAWAEYRLGVSAGSSIALLVALGTGIGAGLLVDGQIYRGAHGVAPELGHLTVVPGGRPCPCGKQGCWERYCSGTALAQTARLQMADHDAPVLRRLSGDDPAAVTGTMVAVAATEGDPVALGAMDELGHWLAAGLALVTDVLDPEMIVIGGGVSAAAGMFLPLAVSEFGRSITGAGHRPLPRVELARFGDRAGIIGAALLAAEAAGTA